MQPARWILAIVVALLAQPAAAQVALKGATAVAPMDEPAPPTPPDPLMDMVVEAVDQGNDGEMDAVVKYATKSSPERAALFKAMADNRRKARAAAQLAKLRDAPIYDLWRGQIELGGFRNTGNTDTIGLSGAVKINRDGFRWRHKLEGVTDYQRSAGVTSSERITAAYENNYKFDKKAYAVSILQYENNRFVGYDGRYSGSLGLGYRALEGRITLDLEVGPAIRYTRFTDGTSQHAVAGRGSLDFAWQVSKAVSLEQDMSIYADAINSSVISTSALTAKLFGPVSARFSYRVQYESQPIDDLRKTDTLSRASVVYSF